MSIEETYKGMWSSDATLLKSLLDAGETIVAVHKAADNVTKLSFSRNEYWACNDDGIYPISEKLDCWSFLIPPRPLVLEWIEPHWRKHEGLRYFEAGKYKDWRVTVWNSPRGGYDITIHYKRANKVSGLWIADISLSGVKNVAEELFEEIKSSING